MINGVGGQGKAAQRAQRLRVRTRSVSRGMLPSSSHHRSVASARSDKSRRRAQVQRASPLRAVVIRAWGGHIQPVASGLFEVTALLEQEGEAALDGVTKHGL